MRIKLSFDEKPIYAIFIPVRITDINYGGHVGNDAMLAIIHEARLSWLKSMQYSEMDLGGCGSIMAESLVQYKAESFHGDTLKIEILVENITNVSFDIIYKITTLRVEKEILIAMAKTTMISFNYQQRKIVPLPNEFLKKINLS